MATVRVSLPQIPADGYDIRIRAGLRHVVGAALKEICPAHRYAVVADATVASLYADDVLRSVRDEGGAAELLTFPAGEANKNRESWAELSDEMLRRGFGRDSAVLALGGGVAGDLAGFVAGTYLRGLPLVHLPTSLLAMIDSSVGGKTGVDTPAGKNLIGVFHQPRGVLADTDTLSTLPAAQLRSGLAEAVKHGAISDADYFEWLAEHVKPLLTVEPGVMARLIERSVQIKAAVVAEDEREGGVRKTLNFGHTAGHAIEALSGFELLHGEAIAIGMIVESLIGEALGVTGADTTRRLRIALGRIGLPTSLSPDFDPLDVLHRTRVDKKAREGQVEYALIEEIGRASIGSGRYGTRVPDEVVLQALEGARAG